MSVATTSNGQKQAEGKTGLVLGLLAVLVAAFLLYVFANPQQNLRTSPTGLDGLRAWLVAEEQSVQIFTGGWYLNDQQLGLVILPLYDTDLMAARSEPLTARDLLMQQDEYDIAARVIDEKVRRVATLVVLPKWRTGMRLTGQAHPHLLIEPEQLTQGLNALLPGANAQIAQSTEPFSTFDYWVTTGRSLSALTYAAQTFSADGCSPILGTEDAIILGQCGLREGKSETLVFILSDPDLINNHGLLLGDNAAIVSDFISRTSVGQQVIIDYSDRSWFRTEGRASTRERSWADLQRFFSGPFTLIWVGLGIALLLTLWRAGVRFGPLRSTPNTLSASKLMAIAARARLMRLSNQDGALTNDYGRARIAAKAAGLFGSTNTRQGSGSEAFLAYVRRRHPALVGQLIAALNTLEAMPAAAPAPQAMAAVNELESVLEQIANDT